MVPELCKLYELSGQPQRSVPARREGKKRRPWAQKYPFWILLVIEYSSCRIKTCQRRIDGRLFRGPTSTITDPPGANGKGWSAKYSSAKTLDYDAGYVSQHLCEPQQSIEPSNSWHDYLSKSAGNRQDPQLFLLFWFFSLDFNSRSSIAMPFTDSGRRTDESASWTDTCQALRTASQY